MNCPNCGNALPENATYCGYCGQVLQAAQPQYQQPQYQQPVQQQNAPVAKKENIVLGLIGAVIGALLGGASIILFLKMEMVAAISGLILAFCSLWGYEKLGGKLSTIGIILCVILMLIVPFVSYDLYLVTEVMDLYSLDFSEAYDCIEALRDVPGYGEDLSQIYIFTILGGAATVWNTIKNKKK